MEAHGTATSLGDPIEVEALKQAWNTKKKGYCALGAVKANLGHLDAAAGVAGFIKTVLVLDKKEIPPMINFNQPNEMLDLSNSPFYINTEIKKLYKHQEKLKAAVSSFGIGGTNAHIILEEAPPQ
jgi:acyl transferase domain-containing protein